MVIYLKITTVILGRKYYRTLVNFYMTEESNSQKLSLDFSGIFVIFIFGGLFLATLIAGIYIFLFLLVYFYSLFTKL